MMIGFVQMGKGEPMSLINREALIAEYDRVHIGEPGKARKLIEDAPTIEPERTGKWTYVTDGYVDYFKCDRCGKPVFADTPYCPNCGERKLR